MRYHTLIFDLDGTVLASGSNIRQQLTQTLQHFQLPRDHDLIEQSLHSGQNVLNTYIRLHQKLKQRPLSEVNVWQSHYEACMQHDCQLFDGIREVLDFARKHYPALYVVSNNTPTYSQKKMQLMGFSDHFEMILGPIPPALRPKPYPDMFGPIKANHPDQQPQQFLMIGDTAADINFALSNHIDSVACLYGYGDHTHIQTLKPTHQVLSTQALKQLLESFL